MEILQDWTNLIMIFSALSTLGLGLYVLYREYKNYRNISFFIFTIGIALWTLFVLLQKVTQDVIWGRLIFLPTPILVYSLFIFSNHFPEPKSKILPSKALNLFLIVCMLLLILVGISPLVIQSVEVVGDQLQPVYGPLVVPIYLVNSLLALLSVRNLTVNYYKSTYQSRLRMQYFLVGFVFMFATMVILSLLIPSITRNYETAFYAPASSLILVLFISFSILRERLWSISYIISRTIYAGIVGTLSLIAFYSTNFIYNLFFGEVFSVDGILVIFTIAALGGLLFIKIVEISKRIIDKHILYSIYDPYKVINELLKINSTELDLSKVVVKSVRLLKDALKVKDAGIVILNKENRKVIFKKITGFVKNNNELQLRELLEIVQYWDYQESLGKKAEIIVLNEQRNLEQTFHTGEEKLRLKRIFKIMEEDSIAVVIPLNRRVQLNGLIIVGSKKNKQPFTVEDINFLESAISNISVSVGRAILHKDVKSLADNLQEKVEQKTKAIQKKNQALEDTLRMERDMLDILGHELRTPLSIFRNAIKMIGMLNKNEVVDKEKLYKYYEIANEQSSRLTKLLETLLSSTKIDNQTLGLTLEKVDMLDVVSDSLDGLSKKAKDKGLDLKVDLPDKLEGYADRTRIQEVVDNLLDNAIKYTHEGQVSISANEVDNSIRVSITDTGEGISDEDLPNLGKKFFRAKSYLETSKDLNIVRPGGTGLGLYVTFELVKSMGGRITVDSEVGKGSTFSFTVPKFSGQNTEEIGGKSGQDLINEKIEKAKLQRKTATNSNKLDYY